MSFRAYKSKGTPVVRIGGVEYLLDMGLRQLRAVNDPQDLIDLDDDGAITVHEDDGPEQENTPIPNKRLL